MNIANVVAVGVGKEHAVAVGGSHGQSGNGESLLARLPVRAGKFAAKVDEYAGVSGADFGCAAADLMGTTVYGEFHIFLLTDCVYIENMLY